MDLERLEFPSRCACYYSKSYLNLVHYDMYRTSLERLVRFLVTPDKRVLAANKRAAKEPVDRGRSAAPSELSPLPTNTLTFAAKLHGVWRNQTAEPPPFKRREGRGRERKKRSELHPFRKCAHLVETIVPEKLENVALPRFGPLAPALVRSLVQRSQFHEQPEKSSIVVLASKEKKKKKEAGNREGQHRRSKKY